VYYQFTPKAMRDLVPAEVPGLSNLDGIYACGRRGGAEISLLQRLIKQGYLIEAPAIVVTIAKLQGKRPFDLEAAVIINAGCCYSYAVLKKKGSRFPAGEPAIAQSAAYAQAYARDILKDRFPKGEEAIKSESFWATVYAQSLRALHKNKKKKALAKIS